MSLFLPQLRSPISNQGKEGDEPVCIEVTLMYTVLEPGFSRRGGRQPNIWLNFFPKIA